MPRPHISVCICTYRRPDMLRRLLGKLENQDRDGGRFAYSVVVADNDRDRSAEGLVADFQRDSSLDVTYCSQPERNIARTRNASIAHARGDLIAFIDDDEFPSPDWLRRLLETLEAGSAAAVLGPVHPHFETPPPDWVVKGRFCERPEYPTGTPVDWNDCRTGNVLFRREVIPDGEAPFREEFGTGGEDKDFFRRLAEAGHTFIWCNEAPVSESVPASRLTRTYMLRRALLRGRNSLRIGGNRLASIAKSAIAVPSYALLLPLALLRGQDHFMHLLIRFCDHSGKLLALIGLNPVRERQM
jgi:glycosyltransferase involved in cell wall biosynthesis